MLPNDVKYPARVVSVYT